MRGRALAALVVVALCGVLVAVWASTFDGTPQLSQSEAEAKGQDMLSSCRAQGGAKRASRPTVQCERVDESWRCSYASARERGVFDVPDDGHDASIIC